MRHVTELSCFQSVAEQELDLDSDDVRVLADAVLREMEAKHAAERKTMMEVSPCYNYRSIIFARLFTKKH